VKIGGNEELIYRAVLAKAGVDKTKLNEIPVKFDITPLLAGAVDVWPGYLINEVLAAKEKGFDVNVVSPPDYGIDLYADTLFTTEKMLTEKPDLVRKFVTATLKGWTGAIAAPEEAAQITVKYGSKLTYDHELAMMKASLPLLQPDAKPVGSMDAANWAAAQKAARRCRLSKSAGRSHQSIHRRFSKMNAITLATRLEATTLSRPEPLVSIENLQVRFDDVVAIENLNFTVGRGEFVSLLGPSGCGKSTLLKAIARLVPLANGKIVLRDLNLRVGFMFQKPLLLPWRTTLDNVLLPVEIQRGGKRGRSNRSIPCPTDAQYGSTRRLY